MSTPMRVPPGDGERERAAELLQRACGDGRITLEEFSVRVGAVWAADTHDELVRATDGLAPAPIVGSARTVDQVTNIFSDTKRRGRWRLRSPRLTIRAIFGATEIDLREVLTDQRVIEISGHTVFGALKVIVPEGVEVDVTGAEVFRPATSTSRRCPGWPAHPRSGSIEVGSKPYALPS